MTDDRLTREAEAWLHTQNALVDNIGELVTNDPSRGDGPLGVVRDAAVLVVDGAVAWIGPRGAAPSADRVQVIDAEGAAVIPGFVDSHAHLAFAGDRAEEFAARMAGSAYSAGGIRSTMDATRAASDDELSANVARLVAEAAADAAKAVAARDAALAEALELRRELERRRGGA